MVIIMKKENKDIELLVTAVNYMEEHTFESILRQNSIPYLKKKKETGGVTEIIMGFSISGVDFYVEAERLDEAAELLEAYTMSAGGSEVLNEDEDAEEE